MTPFDRLDDRFDRRLQDALGDLASPTYPDYFEDALVAAVTGGQRPAWTFPERWIPVSTVTRPALAPQLPWRMVAILALLAALLVAGAIVAFGMRQDRVPAPFGPAANGLVTYQTGGDVYTFDLDSGEERLIVGGPEYDFWPFFSRDGQRVAWTRYERREDVNGTLMVARADGSDMEALTDLVDLPWYAWSTASDSIVAISRAPGDEYALSVIPVAGGTPTVIDVPIRLAGMVELRPPDGDELIFTGAEGDAHAVYGVRLDGSGFRRISMTAGPESFVHPWEFTPNGRHMLYTSVGDVVELGILDLDSGEARTFGAALPEPSDYDGEIQHQGFASVLPDGETIVFGRYWNQAGNTINHQLWRASLAGDGADAVPIGPIHRSQAGADGPFLSVVAPDGTSILVFETGTGEAWIADVDGTNLRAIDFGTPDDPPSWQRLAP